MSGTQECAIIKCTNPVTAICQMCKSGFCKEHIARESYQTSDGRLQYATLCNECFAKAKEGGYETHAEQNRIVAQFTIFFGIVAVLGFIIWKFFL